jgi:hypothetical protein
VITTLGSPLLGVAALVALVVKGSYATTSLLAVALMFAFPLANRQVLRSTLATVSKRPYLMLSDAGLYVDGCIFDSVHLPWSDIEAMAPDPDSIRTALTAGHFVALTFLVRGGPKTRYSFSSIQHPVHRNHFQINGYFSPPPDPDIDEIAKCFASNVKRHEPFLLTDMPD